MGQACLYQLLPGLPFDSPLSVLPERTFEEKPATNVINQEVEAPGQVTVENPEPIITIAHHLKPEGNLTRGLLILLILGFVVLVASIIAS